MDDPWGSPWASEDAQTRLDLPAPPPLVHTPRTPERGLSPWGVPREEEENPWSGGEGVAWRRSPGLRPAWSGTVSRQPSPDGWGERKEDGGKSTAAPIAALGMLDEPPRIEAKRSKKIAEQDTLTNGPRTNEDDARDRGESYTAGNGHVQSGTTLDGSVDDTGSPPGSPRPAIEPDARPQPARQVSKVQELVEMYDGIEKKRAEPAEQVVPGPRIRLAGPHVHDGKGTEEVGEGKPASLHAREAVFADVTDDTKGATSKVNERFDAVADQGTRPEPSQDQTTADQLSALGYDVCPEPLDSRPGPVFKVPSTAFAVDMSQLDALFPSIPPSAVDSEAVPNVIIDDTFASISERRAWYRVSRPGPMRQHNLGRDDDENYVRLDWRGSEVRARSLRIVRRWMEEDSIAGRVGVGGKRTVGLGAVGASLFHWDSKEPELEIGELLGKGKGKGRGCEERASVNKEVPAKSPMTIDATVANEWAPAGGHNKVNSEAQKAGAEDEGEDDDDDWGEMVTSPPIPAAKTSNSAEGTATPVLYMANGAQEASALSPAMAIDSTSLSAANDVAGTKEKPSHDASPGVVDGLLQTNDASQATAHPEHEGTGTATGLLHNDGNACGGTLLEPLVAEPPASREPASALPIQPPTEPEETSLPLEKSPRLLSSEDEKLAHRIIRDLPDLSYMFR